MLRQWVFGSIFTTGFQRQEGPITHFVSFKMSPIYDLLYNPIVINKLTITTTLMLYRTLH